LPLTITPGVSLGQTSAGARESIRKACAGAPETQIAGIGAKKMKSRYLAIAAVLTVGISIHADDDARVPYPQGYRSWTFLHSSLIGPKLPGFWKRPCEKPCTAGIFHFYGNEKAMQGLRTDNYPDGAILAEEMLEFLGSASGAGKEGERRLVGVMVKDSRKYSTTGGWGFGSYDEGSQVNVLSGADSQACFQCHIPRKDQGYVFTKYQER
jgi:hypothetical protein